VGTERGSVSADLLGDTWLYDPAVETWEQIQVESGPPPLACHGMAHDPGTGLIYLWGGQTAMSTGQTTLWSFDPATLEWTEVPTDGAPQPRWTHQMLYEPVTGHIYVIGGSGRRITETDSGSTTSIASTGEVWTLDPSTLAWDQREPLPAPLAGHAAAIDGRGGIVVFSGLSTLVYDADLDTWSDITPDELLGPDG
jgi:N-acetylneuraminic acid mutarotase